MKDYQVILNDDKVTKFISICAWCDANKKITKEYIEKGYRTSHGICKPHRDEVVDQFIKDYEKQGFNIANDDNDSNGMSVVSDNPKT